MPAAFSIRVLDSIIRIEISGSLGTPATRELREPWRSLIVDSALQEDAVVQVIVGDPDVPVAPEAVRVIRTADVTEAAQALTTAVTVEGITRLRGRALLFHAAAVALDDGRVIGFVGPSGRGKTTASRALAQHYGYVTDETLAVLPDLTVIPYPKPLSVLDGPPPKHSIHPATLGMFTAPRDGLKLAAVALLDRRPGLSTAWVERVPLADGIGQIVPETSALVALRRPLGDLADALVHTGGVRRVVYGDASQLPSLVPEIIAAESDAPSIVTIPSETTEDAASDVSTRYRRSPWIDAVRIEDRIVLHDGGRVIVLDGIGPTLWSNADGATFDELVTHATRAVPPPPGIDASAELRKQLTAMTDAGILRIT